MLSSHSSNIFESEFAGGFRTRTPGLNRRIQDQNAAVIQTNGRGKKAVFTPYTPARQLSGKDNAMSVKAPRTGSKLGALLDKTPFPNKQTAPTSQKPPQKSALPLPKSKLVFTTPAPDISTFEEENTSPLPSSTRKKLKLPSSATKLFDVTPPSRINSNWDISDGSIDLGSPIIEAVSLHEEEPEEPEYMPPTAIESDYEPDFELPDFAELGKGLRNLSCFDYEEYNPEDFVDDMAILKASGWTENEDDWERLPLKEIDSEDDCPFVNVKVPAKPSSKPVNSRPTSKKRIVKAGAAVKAHLPKSNAQPSRKPPLSGVPAKLKIPSGRSQPEPLFRDCGIALGTTKLVDEYDVSLYVP